jgi:hypothetical protein
MRTTVVRLGFAAMLLAGGNAAAKLPTGQCLPLRAKAETRCFDRCRTAYERAYAACFGPGRDCVRSCESALHTCQASALATDRDCESGDSNVTSCLNQLVQAIDTCSADGDPHACRTRARIAAVDCRQACVDTAAPVVEECNQTFSDCLRRCSFVR